MADSVLQILIEAVDNASKTIKGITESIGGLEAVGQSMSDIGAAMTVGVTAPIVAGLTAATAQAISFESSMAEVQKAANLDAAGMEQMSAQILEMTRTIPIAAGEIAEITAAGARLGVSGAENLGEFTGLISEMSVAFDMAAGEAADRAAEIANVFNMKDVDGGLDFGAIQQYGDAVNNLADNMATTEAKIIDTTQAMSGIAAFMGMTANETASLGAAMTSLGIQPGVAANAFKVAMQRMGDGTGAIGEGMQALGIDVEAFQQQVSSGEGADAFVSALDAINKSTLGPIEKAQALSDVFGNNYNDTIAQAASGSQAFIDAMGLMEDSVEGNGATMQESFEIMGQTTEAQMQIAKNAMAELGTEIGGVILPAVNDLLGAVTPLIQGFSDFARANPGIVKIGVAIAGIATAVGPALLIVGKLVSAFAALKAMFAAGGALAGIAAIGFGPILAGVAAVAAGAFLIYKNWNKLASFFSGFWEGLSSSMGPALQSLQIVGSTIIQALQPIVSWLSNLILGTDTASGSIANLGMAFGMMAAAMINAVASLPMNIGMIFQSIGAIISANINIIVVRISAVGATIMGVVSGIVSSIIGFISSAIAAVVGAVSSVISAITSGASQAVAAVQSAGQAMVSAIMGIAGQMFSAGANIIGSLVQGIMSRVGEAQAAIANVASTIRGALPFSPPKWGPLSDIMEAGPNIVNSIAGGITPGPVASAMGSALPGANALIPSPSGDGALPSANALMPSPSGGAGGGGSITLNYSPTINGGDRAGIEETLQLHIEELRDMLAQLQHEDSRVSYG